MYIIDSTKYSGPCSTCGKDHAMETKLAVIEAGCLQHLDEYLEKYGLTGKRCAIYDENTYVAKGLVRPAAQQEIILPPENLHANEHGVAMVQQQLQQDVEVLIAVGSGTVHDITRYVAWEKGIPFVSCPTAASVDGFCSGVASMTWEGCKKTLTAVPPTLVLADLNVITQAPIRLARSGFGDMIGKYIALFEWRMAKALVGESYCHRIDQMTMDATKAVLDSAAGIAAGEPAAFGNLTYGLILSGLAMQMWGNSRPASGTEHHISHIIEMEPPLLNVHSDGLHGEKVGVGTLLAAKEYHRLAQLPDDVWGDYPGIDDNTIQQVFGPEMSGPIIRENEKDCAAGITGEQIRKILPVIRQEIQSIPQPETLLEAYNRIGAMTTLSEIQVPDDLEQTLYRTCPMVRNRLTLMRLRRCIQ